MHAWREKVHIWRVFEPEIYSFSCSHSLSLILVDLFCCSEFFRKFVRILSNQKYLPRLVLAKTNAWVSRFYLKITFKLSSKLSRILKTKFEKYFKETFVLCFFQVSLQAFIHWLKSFTFLFFSEDTNCFPVKVFLWTFTRKRFLIFSLFWSNFCSNFLLFQFHYCN